MTLQLRGIPCYLETLVPYLSDDTDIQQEIQWRISDARTLSDRFIHIMASSGTELLNQKNALEMVSNPSKVEVDNLKFALKAMQGALKTERVEMFVFQAKIHTNIEHGRARTQKHKSTIDFKKIEVNLQTNVIKDLESRISVCETEAKIQDQSADNCEKEARTLKRKARKLRNRGLKTSGVIAGVGILSAPFTGGASLVFASGGVLGGLGTSFYLASELEEKARNHRRHANEERLEATRHRERKSSLERQIGIKETEVNSLMQKNEKLSVTCKKLNEIEQQLLTAISVTNTLITKVQDLETTLYAIEGQGKSFRIIQNAFVRNPQKLEGRAQHYLSELKKKWECVEPELRQALDFHSIRN